jgi:hypothetical protein
MATSSNSGDMAYHSFSPEDIGIRSWILASIITSSSYWRRRRRFDMASSGMGSRSSMGIVKVERIHNESGQSATAIWERIQWPSQGGFKTIWGRIRDQDHVKTTLEHHHSPSNKRFNVERIHNRPIQHRFEVERIHTSSQDSVKSEEQIYISSQYTVNGERIQGSCREQHVKAK